MEPKVTPTCITNNTIIDIYVRHIGHFSVGFNVSCGSSSPSLSSDIELIRWRSVQHVVDGPTAVCTEPSSVLLDLQVAFCMKSEVLD